MSGLEDRYGLCLNFLNVVVMNSSQRLRLSQLSLSTIPRPPRNSSERKLGGSTRIRDSLGKVMETAIDAALEFYGDKLTYRDWLTLELFLLKGVLLVLQRGK